MQQIEVLGVGSAVTISDGIPAEITGIAIYGQGRIQYQCAWWSGHLRQSGWLEQFEVVHTDETQGMKIGFQRSKS